MTGDLQRLQAGPVIAYFDGSGLRYVSVDGASVVLRIYFALRMPDWSTVPYEVHDLAVESESDRFRVTFCAQHSVPNFSWEVTIVGEPDGRIVFSVVGTPAEEVTVNRAGLCVLHDQFGEPVEIEQADGTTTRTEFPSTIAPGCPFTSVRRITTFTGQFRASVLFTGEVFETEDQRNWTDASFKTYSRSNAWTLPFIVRPEEPIRQSVTITVSPNFHEKPLRYAEPRSEAPALGTVFRPGAWGDLDPRRVRGLGLSLVRIDLDETQDWRTTLAEGLALARFAQIELQLALYGSPGFFELVVDALRKDVNRVHSVLPFPVGGSATDLERYAAATRHFRDRTTWAGRHHFGDINRNRPPATARIVAYGVDPQVHAFENLDLVESINGQQWTLFSAREFADQVHLSPITFGGSLDRPDPRFETTFAAVWTLGVLSRAHATSAIAFSLFGPQGLLDESGGWRPVSHVIADLSQLATPGQPLRPDLALFGISGTTSLGNPVLMLGNATSHTLRIRSGMDRRFVGRRLNADTQAEARRDPLTFRAVLHPMTLDGLELAPHEVIWMRQEADQP